MTKGRLGQSEPSSAIQWGSSKAVDRQDGRTGFGYNMGGMRGNSSIKSSPEEKARRPAVMPINHEEIIEDIEGQTRKCGGAWGEWCVGTGK